MPLCCSLCRKNAHDLNDLLGHQRDECPQIIGVSAAATAKFVKCTTCGLMLASQQAYWCHAGRAHGGTGQPFPVSIVTGQPIQGSTRRKSRSSSIQGSASKSGASLSSVEDIKPSVIKTEVDSDGATNKATISSRSDQSDLEDLEHEPDIMQPDIMPPDIMQTDMEAEMDIDLSADEAPLVKRSRLSISQAHNTPDLVKEKEVVKETQLTPNCSYECTLCRPTKLYFKSLPDLASHQNTQACKGGREGTTERLAAAGQRCEYCQVVFSSMMGLCVHRGKIHNGGATDSRAPKMDGKVVSPQAKRTSTARKPNINAENSENIFKCDECGACYPTKMGLGVHKGRSHGPDAPRGMNGGLDSASEDSENEGRQITGDQTDPSQWNVTNNSNFKCSLCPSGSKRRFNNLKMMREHQITDHNISHGDGISIFQCRYCHVCFATKGGLSRHKTLVHMTRPDADDEDDYGEALECELNNYVYDGNGSELMSRPTTAFSDIPIEKLMPTNSIEDIPHSTYSAKIQAQLDSFLREKDARSENENNQAIIGADSAVDLTMAGSGAPPSAADDTSPKSLSSLNIAVRQLANAKNSIEISRFAKQFFSLPHHYRAETTSRTLFLFENVGTLAEPQFIIAFALFAQENKSTRTAFITHMGVPGYVCELDDDRHWDLYCRFLLAYLSCLRDDGFTDVNVTMRDIDISEGESAEEGGLKQDPIFFHTERLNTPRIRLSYSWLFSTMDDAARFGVVQSFDALLDRYQNDLSYKPPLFVDRSEDWCMRFEQTVLDRLVKNPRQLLEEPNNRPLKDAIALQMLASYDFLIVKLMPRVTPNQFFGVDQDSAKACLIPTPVYMSDAAKFREKCRNNDWRFDSLSLASRTTSHLLRHATLLAAEAQVSMF